MHVAADLDRLLQLLGSASVEMAASMVAAFLNLIRSTSSTVLSAAFDFGSTDGGDEEMAEAANGGAFEVPDSCGRCNLKYCSGGCQSSHCNSEHEYTKSPYALREGEVSLLSAVGSSEVSEQSNKILFPYEKFVRFFNWEVPGYPPCGLKNYGNSCFANVVLQCLTYTRPLAAYLLEEGHKIECRMDTWCFLCTFQTHMERVRWSFTSFVPIDILSRLHNIGGNLEHGNEEDAHEFMRFAIDKMQSVFLNEFGGEMATHLRYQETSLVQHIFGGCLQSQVICSKCKNVSIQFEHMMDLTVEINGDAGSLEECLNQFTAEEWLHGDNMYKCDCCSAYVMARKRLGIQQAPNILTIALKRFQSGRFNQLDKRVAFPETLDLRPYMTELENGDDVYKLYAVIVHVGAPSVSFCGHYICYVKDFGGNCYRVDDDKVSLVGLNEVLSQGAYMLLYSRICARPSCLLPAALLKEQENNKMKIRSTPLTAQPVDPIPTPPNTKCSEVEPNSRIESSSMRIYNDVEMASFDAWLPSESIESHNSDGFSKPQKESVFPLKLDNHNASCGYDIKDDVGYNRRDTNGSLLRRIEVQKEEPGSCTYMHRNAECEGNECGLVDDGLFDTKCKLIMSGHKASEVSMGGLSPEMKLKPLSALGGRRRRELFKQQNSRVSVAVGPRIHPNHRFLSG